MERSRLLKLFVAYGSQTWREEFAPALADGQGRTVSVRVDGGPAWLVRTETTGASATDEAAPADATVTGDPAGVLRWLWARESIPTADAPSPVRVEGDEETLSEFRRLLVASTQ